MLMLAWNEVINSTDPPNKIPELMGEVFIPVYIWNRA
jgi:hypothetical protein